MIHTSYTVGITTGEYRALQYVTGDIDFWVSNVLKERARNAYEDIQQKYVTTKISKGEPITAIGSTAIIEAADAEGIIGIATA